MTNNTLNSSEPILSLTKFLSRVPLLKEVSLLIADSVNEMSEFKSALKEAHFEDVANSLSMLESIEKGKNIYIILSEANAKEIYDIAIQYPTGSISYQSKNLFINPKYGEASLLILSSKDVLKGLEGKGLSVRNIAGPTYQK